MRSRYRGAFRGEILKILPRPKNQPTSVSLQPTLGKTVGGGLESYRARTPLTVGNSPATMCEHREAGDLEAERITIHRSATSSAADQRWNWLLLDRGLRNDSD
jgi:hypothetical protein